MYRNDKNENMVGSGQLRAAIVEKLDTVGNACINIGSDCASYPGADPTKQIVRQSIIIDNDGESGELLITLKRYFVDGQGSALASGVEIKMGDETYTTGSGGVVSHTFAGNTYNVLHDLIEAMNKLPGFVVTIRDALSTLDTGTDDFVDVAETTVPAIQHGGMDTLVTTGTFTAVKRIGLPRPEDKNPLQLLEIRGKATGTTSGTLKLIRDNDAEYKSDASHQEEYVGKVLASAETQYIDRDVTNGDIIRGSVVLVASSNNLSAVDLAVKFRQAIGL